MSSVGYHEPVDELSDETRDMRRAIASSMKAILAHNRDEETEHAAMVLEWIRRHDAVLSKELQEFLFNDKPITHG